MRISLTRVVFAFVLLLISGACSSLIAVAPANDLFANRILITGMTNSVSGSNVDATKEFSEPNHVSSGGKSAWWSWVAPTNASVTIDTIGSSFDTLLAVYNGTAVDSLILIASDDDSGGSAKSKVTFSATAGVTYQIAVDGWNGLSGSITLNLKAAAISPLPEISWHPYSQTAVVGGSAAFDVSASGTPPFWYQWYFEGAPISGATNMYLSLYNVQLNQAGNYHVVVSNAWGTAASSNALLTVVMPPPNDAFANRILITGLTNTVTGSNFGATQETGEPYHGGLGGGHSVWWTWTAPTNATVTLDATETTFYSIVAVYTGDSVSNLTSVGSTTATGTTAFNASAGAAYHIAVDGYSSGDIVLSLKAVPISPAPKITWHPYSSSVPVGGNIVFNLGFSGQTPLYFQWYFENAAILNATNSSLYLTNVQLSQAGNYRAVVSNAWGTASSSNALLTVLIPPPNDAFTSRTAITGMSNTVTGSNAGATRESFEPFHAGMSGGKSVWWSWTAPTNASVSLDTVGSSFSTQLGVYTGSTLETLSSVASDFGSGSNYTSLLNFTATAGVEYQIAVDSYSSGNIVLNLRAAPIAPTIPAITTHPQSQAVIIGNPCTFFVSATGTAPLYYQWRFGETLLGGANASSLFIPNVQPSNAGTYSVIVSNAYGIAVSSNAVLTAVSAVTVTFVDPNLESAVRNALYKPTGVITAADMLNLRSLSASWRSITNLSGLEYALNLTNLNLYYNNIKDLAPLTNLSALSSLDLERCTLTNVSLLSGLTSLKELHLSYNQLKDVSPLAGLTGLRVLELNENAITNVSALAGLTQLTTLSLNYTGTRDISFLTGCSNLQKLELNLNAVQDLSPLVNKTNLTRLFLGQNSLTNAGIIGQFTNLTEVDLRGVSMDDLSLFAGMPNLSYLAIGGGARIGSFALLPSFSKLTYLEISDCGFTTPSVLAGLTNLTTLELGYNALADVNAISSLRKLEILGLNGNRLTSIGFVTNHTALTSLSVGNNRLTNIGAATNLINLYYFGCANNALDLTSGSPSMMAIQLIQNRGAYVDYNPQILTPPIITGDPQSQMAAPGSDVEFWVYSTNNTPDAWFYADYQWQFNGVDLPGETAQSLKLHSVQTNQAGFYSVVVSSPCCSVTSSNAALTIYTPPANDHFTNAFVIVDGETNVFGWNAGASKEDGEPDHVDNAGGRSVWWTWTPYTNVTVTLDTIGSDFDTLLAVYTGSSVSNLSLIAENDESGPNHTSVLTFLALAGTTYHIAVDGYSGVPGNVAAGAITLNFQFAAPPAMPNLAPYGPSTWSDSLVISVRSGTTQDSYTIYTHDDLFIDWGVANYSEVVNVNSLFYISLYVDGVEKDFWYAEGLAANYWIYNTDFELGKLSAGTHTIELRVDSEEMIAEEYEYDNTYTRTIEVLDSSLFNDAFAQRVTLTGSLAEGYGNNEKATAEPNEPAHAGEPATKSLWWTWTAPTNATVCLTTMYSDFDTVLAVYTGDNLTSLVPVASDDESGGNSTSLVRFQAVAGVTYQIAVDGYQGDCGNVGLTLDLVPGNDLFANRFAVEGASITVTGSNNFASKEEGEPDHAGDTGGNSVWWTWTAPTTGAYTIDTFGSSFDTLLAVYTGDSVASLIEIGSNDEYADESVSLVNFQATAGQTYQIAVDGWDGDTGTVTLNINPAPANNAFANRIAISGSTNTITASNIGASLESDEPAHAGEGGGRSVWWTWTAPGDGTVQLDTFDSSFDTLLAVYTGDSVTNLTEIVSNDDYAGKRTSYVTFQATAGTTYQIAIDGYAMKSGNIILHLAAEMSAPATPPEMKISVSASGLTLDWSAQAAGYVLETTDSLSPTSTWVPVTNAVSTGNGVMLSNPGTANAFYRLRKQ